MPKKVCVQIYFGTRKYKTNTVNVYTEEETIFCAQKIIIFHRNFWVELFIDAIVIYESGPEES